MWVIECEAEDASAAEARAKHRAALDSMPIETGDGESWLDFDD